jgi:hypothetical protein
MIITGILLPATNEMASDGTAYQSQVPHLYNKVCVVEGFVMNHNLF